MQSALAEIIRTSDDVDVVDKFILQQARDYFWNFHVLIHPTMLQGFFQYDDHQPGAAQFRNLGRMPLVLRRHKQVDRRRHRVIAEDVDDGVDEHALAIGAGAVQEQQHVLGCFAGHAVAEEALQEAD